MTDGAASHTQHSTPEGFLRAYLPGTIGFDTLLGYQRRLVYEIGGERSHGAVLLCDHPPGVTLGREGSRLHLRTGPDLYRARGWPVRWVARGGGAMLHLPGQLACYPILALDRLGLTPAAYLALLTDLAVNLLRDYDIPAEPDPVCPGVRVGTRRIAHVGIAVRSWVSCFGLVLNIDPDLEPFRDVRCDGCAEPMTSIQREVPTTRIRYANVRMRLLDDVAARFGFNRVSWSYSPPGTSTRHAAPTRSC